MISRLHNALLAVEDVREIALEGGHGLLQNDEERSGLVDSNLMARASLVILVDDLDSCERNRSWYKVMPAIARIRS